MSKISIYRFGNKPKILFIGSLMLVTSACNFGGGDQVSEAGRLGDFVWRDANTNGIQDGDERGVENVTVNLLDENLQPVASDISDREGAYEFGNLDSGRYILQFHIPADGDDGVEFGFTLQHQGEDRSLDSDVDPFTSLTNAFDYEAGTTDLSLDAGIVGDEPSDPADPEPEEEDQGEVGGPGDAEPAVDDPIEEEAEAPPQIMAGLQRVNAWITMGEGDCMANPSDFHIVLTVLVNEDGSMEVAQNGIHLNAGSIELSDGMFEVRTGEGPDTEGYKGMLNKDFSGEGTYTYITSSGTCTYKFEFMPTE